MIVNKGNPSLCDTCIRGPLTNCTKAPACINDLGWHTLRIEGNYQVNQEEEEIRMDTIGQNGNEGLHYQETNLYGKGEAKQPGKQQTSDGSTAHYYELPAGAKELQDLISVKDMNAQLGEIFRAAYRYGDCPHSPKIRDIKKIIFYAQAELARLEKLA